MKIENLLNDLIKINTVNDLENQKIIDYLEDYLKSIGFKTEYKTKCLVMSIGKDPILSFIGHTDVVSVSKDWNYSPFELTKVDDKLIGRGVSDMKGGIAAFLYTLKQMDLFEVPFNTINIGTINGGTNICTTSDYTRVLLGFRITKLEKDIIFIKNYIDNLTSKYSKVEYKIINEIKPFYNEDSIIDFYEEITKKKRTPFFGVSEASFIDNNRLILGPGPITAHENDEFILKSSLMETVDIYKKIIERICK